MDYSYYLGVDVSKHHLDLCLVDATNELLRIQCANTCSAITEILSELPVEDLQAVLVCAEYTGMYTYRLLQAAGQVGVQVWLEHPTQLLLSSGMHRGKNDAIDAARIAWYARRFAARAQPASLGQTALEQLKYLLSERRLLVTDRAKYKAQLKDQRGYMPGEVYEDKARRLRQIITCFDDQITQIETRMDQVIADDPVLARHRELLESIPGVGPRLAVYVMVASQGFTRFSDPRAFSCHAGIAPFSYHSGIHTHSRARVSHRADKQLKSLLHMAALSVVSRPGELQDYYLRKCGEGKPKMSVLNAVRSKLVHRMFAVIKRNQKYIPAY